MFCKLTLFHSMKFLHILCISFLYKYIFGTRFSVILSNYHNTSKCSLQITLSKAKMMLNCQSCSESPTHLCSNTCHLSTDSWPGPGKPSAPSCAPPWSPWLGSELRPCRCTEAACDIPPRLSGSWAGRMTRPPCSCVPPEPRTAQRCCTCQSPGVGVLT